ncbi:MAG TPA: vWA domain-containing protein, partial [Vicinamibacterales bacterium]|nr:vWA domain-containing protein [Vicinamibacterales bacterium]
VDLLSLSFLDSICFGFGAVILLLVISKIFEPIRLEEGREDLEGLVAQYEQELNDILGETELIQRERNTTVASLGADRSRIGDLQSELVRIRAAVLQEEDPAFENGLEGRLAAAKQTLTEEMQRLLADYRPPIDDYVVGGIPVDSEYIVFLIDTSGSMKQFMWDRVLQQLSETLQVYPTVKGIQVLNDEGEYMFKSYRNEWIPDTPSRRQAIIDSLKNWNAFSNSNPREGIIEAIRTFYAPDKKISLYVYSDDFASGTGSINAVVREVDRLNREDRTGQRRVRIHAVAFPALYAATGELYSAADFATLMRVLCQRNGGTFVALPLLRNR